MLAPSSAKPEPSSPLRSRGTLLSQQNNSHVAGVGGEDGGRQLFCTMSCSHGNGDLSPLPERGERAGRVGGRHERDLPPRCVPRPGQAEDAQPPAPPALPPFARGSPFLPGAPHPPGALARAPGAGAAAARCGGGPQRQSPPPASPPPRRRAGGRACVTPPGT